MSADHLERYSEEEWEHIRKRFFNSILNDTEIVKLGQNVGVSWPFKGSDETPSKYIEYSFDELKDVPGLIGKQRRLHSLIDILRETLAFDDPFADMVETVESESEEDDTFERILAKLMIPTTLPSEFLHFSPDTNELVKNEDLKTLLEVIHFGQKLARSVVVGGDLKTFLNGLAHKDEPGIKKHIPYRRGERGVHLAEAIGLIGSDLDEATQYELLLQSGEELTAEEESIRVAGSPLKKEAAIKVALQKVDAVCNWFTAEASELEQLFSSGGKPERFFIYMNEPQSERTACALARFKYGSVDGRKGGFMGKLSGLFAR